MGYYQQGQAEVYGVFHHRSLIQSQLDHTLEALQGLFAEAILSVHQELLRRPKQFSQYFCDDMKTKLIEISLANQHAVN